MQANKHFLHGFVEAIVHGEAFGVPIDRVTQATHLLSNGAAGFFFPFPDFFEEVFTAHGVTIRLVLCSEFALNHHLRGDTGVVSTDLPQGFFALHALVAGEGVLNSVLERVTHVQRAGDIRWWNHDGVTFAGQPVLIRLEVAFLFPLFVPGLFNCAGFIGLIHYSLLLTCWHLKMGASITDFEGGWQMLVGRD